ncbi:MAG: flagellin [Alphaproteobacteria bacterium]|nr:flagellin [Alphaproteobacteria bacterium]
MAAQVNLSAATRTNLLALQNTTKLIGRTQERLSTGLKVNSALDDASAFFQSRSLVNRAGDLSGIKDSVDQGVQTLKTALNGIEQATKIVEQIKGLAESARTALTATERSALANQAERLATQLNNLINDSSYNGVNLIKSTPDNLQVNFNEDSTIELTITGINLSASNLGADISTATNNWGTIGDVGADIDDYSSALGQLRTAASTLGSQNTLLQTRLDFTKTLIDTLKEGSDKLVSADMNEEGANLLALQTRQQLGVNSLSLAAQSEQAILSLFQ